MIVAGHRKQKGLGNRYLTADGRSRPCVLAPPNLSRRLKPRPLPPTATCALVVAFISAKENSIEF